jgi:hypothetical protein
MRAFVLYDQAGTITSVGIPAAEESGAQALLSQPEQSLAQVDIPGLEPTHLAAAGQGDD